MKICIACGMPMEKAADFAMNDTSKDYCVHCARPDGTMQLFEEKKKALTSFIIKTQGLNDKVAETVAESMMRKLPAWQEYFS